MPLFYSISEGISLGVISYVLLNVAVKKGKKVAPLMYVLAVLFCTQSISSSNSEIVKIAEGCTEARFGSFFVA